ncbi:MAG TPA: alpha-glucosidase/alpha-galactosidase, partial [Anaerolineae bacterium]
GVDEKYNNQDILANESAVLPRRSIEYGSYIIEAMETGKPFKLNGNVINNGMISNLPADCCAEGPIYVDRLGLHKTVVGELPPQCAALNLTNINVQRLAVEAGLSGDPEHIVHACALDPLSSARLTLNEIREMACAMLDAESQWLPQFAGKTISPTPTIVIPKDVKRADVPVDPALAIMARFGELAK